MDQLNRFNFWNKEVNCKDSGSSTGCTSDQDGSQEDGGDDCNADGDA
ncbi:hypothetical protein ACFLZ0_00090 [Patescibacteria group bacterium]